MVSWGSGGYLKRQYRRWERGWQEGERGPRPGRRLRTGQPDISEEIESFTSGVVWSERNGRR